MVNDLKDKAKETADAITKEGTTWGQLRSACERKWGTLGPKEQASSPSCSITFPQPDAEAALGLLYQDLACCPLLFPGFF